eukprot:jgi/Tetstr1/429249/TSEL_001911.t2
MGTIKASSLQPYLSAVNNFFKDHGREPMALGDLVSRVRKGLAASQVTLHPELMRAPLPARVVLKAMTQAKALRLELGLPWGTDPSTVVRVELFRARLAVVVLCLFFCRGGAGVECRTGDLTVGPDGGILLYHPHLAAEGGRGTIETEEVMRGVDQDSARVNGRLSVEFSGEARRRGGAEGDLSNKNGAPAYSGRHRTGRSASYERLSAAGSPRRTSLPGPPRLAAGRSKPSRVSLPGGGCPPRPGSSGAGPQALEGRTPREGPSGAALAALADTLRPAHGAAGRRASSMLRHADVPVCVVVHVRPLVGRELELGCSRCLKVDDEGTEVSVPAADKTFSFDQVFGVGGVPAGQLYPQHVAPLVAGVFDGFNATVLAYGQTGSGKTFTMGTGLVHCRGGGQPGGQQVATSSGDIGSPTKIPEHPNWVGVVPAVMESLFERVGACGEDVSVSVKCSFIEIYQNHIRDLLTPNDDAAAIELREDSQSRIQVLGAREVEAQSQGEMMEWLQRGMSFRATSGTAMNLHSSRSHAIFTISVQQRRSVYLEYGDDSPQASPAGSEREVLGQESLAAKMHLVDLAGSERLKKSGASGVQQREAACINLGLLNLRNVIEALVTKLPFVPYRSNKLTRLLQDSLGGSARTLFVACVSPADNNIEETLSTLTYAAEARKIKNKPLCNRDKESEQFVALKEELRRVREELLTLKAAGVGDQYSLTAGASFDPPLAESSPMGDLQQERDKWRARATLAEAKAAEASARLGGAGRQAGAHWDETMVSASVDKSFSVLAGISGPGGVHEPAVDTSCSSEEAFAAASGSRRALPWTYSRRPPQARADSKVGPGDGQWLRDLLGEQHFQQIQLDHQQAELSSRAHFADAARARLLTLEGSLLQRRDGFLRPPQHKAEVVEWVQRATCLENQEQELGVMLEAEMARRASLAAELRLVRYKVQCERELGGDSEQERVAALEGELARKSADVAELQRLQIQARALSRSQEMSKKNLTWITPQDARLVLAATYRAAASQYGELLGMGAEVLRLRAEVRWRDRLMGGLRALLPEKLTSLRQDHSAGPAGVPEAAGAALLAQSDSLNQAAGAAVATPQPPAVDVRSLIARACAAPTPDTAASAAQLLAQLSSSAEAMAACRPPDVAALCSMLSHGQEGCRCASALCLAAIARSGATRAAAVVEAGATEALLAALRATATPGCTGEATDEAGSAAAASALEALAQSGNGAALAALAAELDLLLEVLASVDPGGGASSALLGCVAALVDYPGTAAAAAARPAVVPLLAGSLARSSWRGAGSAARALAALLASEADVTALGARVGAWRALVALLERAGAGPGGAGGAAEYGARLAGGRLAASVARWPAGRDGLLAAGALPPLVRCLWVEAASGAGEAAGVALRRLACAPPSRPGVLAAGALFAFVHAAGAGSALARETAARAMEALAQSGAVKEALGRVGGIPALVRLLADRNPAGDGSDLPARTAAARALLALMTEEGGREGAAAGAATDRALWRAALARDNRLAVVRSGGEGGLVALLQAGEGGGEAAAAGCLAQLVRSEACRRPVAGARGHTALLGLLAAGGEAGRLPALRALEALAQLPRAAAELRDDGALAVLGRLVVRGTAESEAAAAAGAALAALMNGAAACEEVAAHPGLLPQLLAMLAPGGSASQQAAALRVVTAMATHSSEVAQRLVALEPMLPRLTALVAAPLAEGEPTLAAAAAAAMSRLARTHEGQVGVAACGGAAALADAAMRSPPGEPLEAAALDGLAACAANPEAAGAVANALLLAPAAAQRLTGLLPCSARAPTALALLSCLAAASEAGSSAVLAAGAVAPLVAALSGGGLGRALAAQLLGALAPAAGGAAAILAEGGAPTLLAMLRGEEEGDGAAAAAALALVGEHAGGVALRAAAGQHAAGAPAMLVGLLHGAAAAWAARAMAVLLGQPGQWAEAARAGAVPLLGSMLSGGAPEGAGGAGVDAGRQAASACLAAMGWLEGGGRELHSAGVLGHALALLDGAWPPPVVAGALHVIAAAAGAPEAQDLLHQGGPLPRIVAMLGSDAEEVAAAAAGALEALSQRDAGAAAAVSAAGAVPPLVALLGAGLGRGAQAAAAGALESLALDGGAQRAAAAAGAVPALLRLLAPGHDGCRVRAGKVLTNLALEAGLRAEMLAGGAVPALVRMLSRGEAAPVRDAAASAVENLALHGSGAAALAARGGALPGLVDLLRSGSALAVEAAAGALENLALADALRGAVVDAGAVPPLVELLGAGGGAAEAAAGALQNLALDAAAREEVVAAGGVAGLVGLLGASEPGAAEAAAGALGNLALNSNGRALLGATGGAPRLVALLGGGDAAAEAAAGAVENASLDERLARQLVDAGAVEALASIVAAGGVALLVALLRSGSDAAKEAAAEALERLSSGRGQVVAIANVGGLEELLRIIQQGNPEAIKAAACTIANFAFSHQNSSAIERAGGVPILLELLQRGEGPGREGAARALRNMSLSEGNRQRIAELGGLAPLVALLRAGSPAAAEAAAGAVEHLALSDANRLALLGEGAAEGLVGMLCGGGPAAQRVAARAIVNLTTNDTCKSRVAQVGAVPALIALLAEEGDEALVAEAARALQNLSLLAANRRVIAEAGGIGPLLTLLEKSSFDTQELAACALWSLAVLPENREAIVRRGGLSLLLELGQRGTPAGREAAASALQNLAVDEDISLAVERAGGLFVLLELLASGTASGREAAAGALQNLVLVDRIRDGAAAAAAVPPLVGMLGGGAAEAEAAAGALRNLAISDALGVAIASSGGVPPLLGLLGGTAGPGAAAAAAGALENLLLAEGRSREDGGAEALPLLVAPDAAVPPLVGLLLYGAPPERDAAVGALEAAAARDAGARAMVGALGGLPPLLRLLAAGGRGGDPGGGEEERGALHSACLAAGLLEALALDDRNAEELVELGLPVHLCAFLHQVVRREDCALGREAAAGALCNLALREEHRPAVLAAGAVPPLAELLAADTGGGAAEVAAAALRNLAAGEGAGAVADAVARQLAAGPPTDSAGAALRGLLAEVRAAAPRGGDGRPAQVGDGKEPRAHHTDSARQGGVAAPTPPKARVLPATSFQATSAS